MNRLKRFNEERVPQNISILNHKYYQLWRTETKKVMYKSLCDSKLQTVFDSNAITKCVPLVYFYAIVLLSWEIIHWQWFRWVFVIVMRLPLCECISVIGRRLNGWKHAVCLVSHYLDEMALTSQWPQHLTCTLMEQRHTVGHSDGHFFSLQPHSISFHCYWLLISNDFNVYSFVCVVLTVTFQASGRTWTQKISGGKWGGGGGDIKWHVMLSPIY